MSDEDKESRLNINTKDVKDKLAATKGQEGEKVDTNKEQLEDKDGGGIPYKVKAGAFLAFAGGFGLLAGFGGALAQASAFQSYIIRRAAFVLPLLELSW